MGFLRTLIIFLLIYLIFRYITRLVMGKLSSLPQRQTKNKTIQDEMVPCPTCNTYNAKSHAYVSEGKFYCNEKCLKENRQ